MTIILAMNSGVGGSVLTSPAAGSGFYAYIWLSNQSINFSTHSNNADTVLLLKYNNGINDFVRERDIDLSGFGDTNMQLREPEGVSFGCSSFSNFNSYGGLSDVAPSRGGLTIDGTTRFQTLVAENTLAAVNNNLLKGKEKFNTAVLGGISRTFPNKNFGNLIVTFSNTYILIIAGLFGTSWIYASKIRGNVGDNQHSLVDKAELNGY